jgi:hypothetical protein
MRQSPWHRLPARADTADYESSIAAMNARESVAAAAGLARCFDRRGAFQSLGARAIRRVS